MRSRLVAVFLLILVIGLSSNLGHTSTSVKVYSYGRITYPAISSYENVTTHEGDLIIGGTQTFLIENCTYIQTGNIYVKDYGFLTIRNAELFFNLSSDRQFQVKTFDGANFTSTDSTILANKHARFYFAGSSQVLLINSNVSYDSMHEMSEMPRLCFQDTSNGSISDSYVESITTGGNSHLTVENLTCWGADSSDQSSIFFLESTLGTAGIAFNGCSGVAKELQNGHVSIFNTFQNFTLSKGSAPNVTIIDSEVRGGVSAFLSACNMNISDSTLDYLDVYYGSHVNIEASRINNQMISCCGSQSFVVDCFLGTFSCFYDAPLSKIVNSTIWLLGAADANVFPEFDNVSVWSFYVLDSEFHMSGNITYHLSPHFYMSWQTSNVTRNFNVITVNATREPLQGVELKLYEQDNTLMWHRVSDSLGKATFNLTFTDGNYTDTLRLEASKGNLTDTAYVEFLTDTPVVLKMRYLYDLNGDGTVNILDIFIVANAFGSGPGDANWNEVADLSNDSIVDILDIFAVAWDFGKTV